MPSESDSAQRRITEFWSAVATDYESHPGNTVPVGSAAYDRWTEMFRRLLGAAPCDVADLGTGTGFAASIAASLGHRVVGIDLADGMLAVAGRQAIDRGLEVRWVKGDAVTPPLEEGSVDAITCRHLIWTLRDAVEALKNWRKLLRPLGRVIAFDALRHWQDPAVEPDPNDFFGRYYTSCVQSRIPFMRITSPTPLIEAFENVGFSNVHADFLPRSFAEDDPDARPYVLVARR